MGKKAFLPYGKQSIDEDDVAAVLEVLNSDWLTTGPAIEKFESCLTERVGVAHGIACSNGTAALHLAARALDLNPGDYVVVPAITFLATANAIRYVGAEVLFSDVDPDTGLMRPEDLEAVLDAHPEKPVRAVCPVHFAGQTVDMPKISMISKERNLFVIEDACHALGTTYQDEDGKEYAVGNCRHSDMAIFSFHPVKTLTTGEGGMITLNHSGMATRLKLLRNHGMVREADEFINEDLALDITGAKNPWYYEMGELGFNYRLTDIQCALGISQVGKLDGFVQRRRELANLYYRGLSGKAAGIQPLGRRSNVKPSWHIFPALIDFDALRIERSVVMKKLSSAGIGSQVHYIPVCHQPYYRRRYGYLNLAGANEYYRRTLTLPLYASMSDQDVELVLSKLYGILGLTPP